jgi:transposase-like protein
MSSVLFIRVHGLNPKSETLRIDALCIEWSEQMAKKAKWRRHTLEFKRQVVERMKTCQNIHELARELKLQRKLLYTWKYQFEGRPEPRHANLGIAAEDRKEKQHRDEIAKLKAALADKTLENDFFRSALLKVKEGRQQNTETGASASTTSSGRGRKSKAR